MSAVLSQDMEDVLLGFHLGKGYYCYHQKVLQQLVV